MAGQLEVKLALARAVGALSRRRGGGATSAPGRCCCASSRARSECSEPASRKEAH
jgi:hypothetical protein